MLENLNEMQKKAVTHKDGPLLILAGAGSGKTKVLTTRIAYLIKEEGVNPENILAITFTNKAAGEMKERIEKLIGKTNLQASTFHSFGVKILRENYDKLGYKNNFVIMDSDDSLTLVKKIIKDLGYDPKRFSPYMIRNKISSNKAEFVMPEEYKKFVHCEEDDIVYKVYKKYQEILFKNNSVDFDDLLILPLKLFKENPEVLNYYQEKYRYILIDEYQDTNQAQYLIVKSLAEKYKNIACVGDNDQCLLPESKIKTDKGVNNICDIKKGDLVSTAIGFGKTGFQEVESISKKKYKGEIIKIKTRLGKSISATPNHVMFSFLKPKSDHYYVYLMYKRELGFRIGQTSGIRRDRKIENGVKTRLRGENGDRIWIVKVCTTKEEATYYEEYYSARYGLPKVVFKAKGRNISLSQDTINKFYKEIPTSQRAEKLMQDEYLYFEYPHHFGQTFVSNERYRKNICITFLGGSHYKNDNYYSHRIALATSDEKDKEELTNLGFNVRKSKFGAYRIETERKDYNNAEYYARMIESLKDDYIIHRKMKLLDDKPYNFMPIGSLREGMSIVSFCNDKLIEDEVVEISKEFYDGYVYDINVKNTRNYLADDICVHNSIYAFRGANYKNILNFEKDYPTAEIIMLEQNYRSTKTILNAANSVIKNNNFRKDKNLWSDKEEGEKISFYKAYDEVDEVFYIIRKIKELVSSGASYQDIAILYRTNAQSRVFEQELLKQNLPFRIIGSFYFYSRKEIKDLLAYLRLIHNSDDDISLMRCINTPKRGIGPKTISEIEESATFYNTSMFSAIKDGKALEFKKIILELKEDLNNCSLTEFIEKVLEKTGMRKALQEEKSLEADIRLENLEEFKSVTKNFEERVGVISLEEFLLEVSLVSDIEEYKDDPNRVTLMTVHAVKGLEFPYVFISGLEEGIFPHKNSYSPDELEEERRLMYVAITRAMKKLWITSAKKRMIYGQESPSILSRFVKEINEDLLECENKDEKKQVKKEKNIYDSDQTYNYGDKVEHDTYGLGVVIEVTNTILTVAFNKNVGIKKILKNHKSIRRV